MKAYVKHFELNAGYLMPIGVNVELTFVPDDGEQLNLEDIALWQRLWQRGELSVVTVRPATDEEKRPIERAVWNNGVAQDRLVDHHSDADELARKMRGIRS